MKLILAILLASCTASGKNEVPTKFLCSIDYKEKAPADEIYDLCLTRIKRACEPKDAKILEYTIYRAADKVRMAGTKVCISKDQ
jgi:hypothetical protein